MRFNDFHVPVVDLIRLDRDSLVFVSLQRRRPHVERPCEQLLDPQPQPMSGSIVPGCRPSLPNARSVLAIWASSSVMSSRSK
jgi:hypothetical protein